MGMESKFFAHLVSGNGYSIIVLWLGLETPAKFQVS